MASPGAQSEAALLAVISELRGQLADRDAQLAAALTQIAGLTKAVAELTAQVAALSARLGANSSNSSKPPSSDGPAAPPRIRSLRGKTGRAPGGQPGREGKTLAMVAVPDRVVEHRPDACGGCGNPLDGGEVVGVEARQVFDLPPISIEVTEHRLATVGCQCGVRTKAPAPAGVTRQVQYGPGVGAVATLLVNRHYVPPARTAELLTDLVGVSISPATVTSMTATAAARIEAVFRPVVERMIANAQVAHVDETGFRIDGKTRWVHSISTDTVAWIQVHDKRGREAIGAIGMVGRFAGVLVRDAFAAYDKLAVAGHQLCVAHVLRELQSVTDSHRHERGQWCWATQVADGLNAIITDPATFDANQRLINSAVWAANLDPSAEGSLTKKHDALRRRILKRMDDYLRFATTPGVPPTNNAAEREIRMVKVKQKVSGAMRTTTGANQFLAVRSYLSTALKHGVGYLDALGSLATTQPWVPSPGR